jgi:ribosomal protein S18 acetylase RimI-like enzyme
MENIIYDKIKKDLPVDQLHKIFKLVGWSDGSETPEMIQNYNKPFINSTLVISAWKNDKLIAFVRVLSDKMIRSIIYDLAVDPEYQKNGIGSELVKRCIENFPNSEWLVGTEDGIASFYEKNGFKKMGKNGGVFLGIPCKLFTINY